MFRSLRTLENRVHQLLEKQEEKREKEQAQFLKEMAMKPEPKKKRAISTTQILDRFTDMLVRHARPALLSQMICLLNLEEQVELQKLIDEGQFCPSEAKQDETVVKPIGRTLSKRKRPISASEMLARFQQMKVHRPQLVFDLSRCLTQREKRTLQDLLDSAFRARSAKASDNPQAI